MGRKKADIVMMSDFGIDSGLVACMHGICKLVDKDLNTYDITHMIPAFDIEAASYCLQYTVPCWPEGTIFVSVVDPGVGTSRRACVARLKNGSYIVTPDNGTLSYVCKTIGVESIRQIDEKTNRYQKTRDVHTFHGRDVFAYCAAKLAAGIITFEEVGQEYSIGEIVLHEIKDAEVSKNYVKAYIQGYDPFGSAELSVTNENFKNAEFKLGDSLKIKIMTDNKEVFHGIVPYEKSFGYVEKGKNVIFNDLASYVTIACNENNFAKTYNLDADKTYTVEIEKY